MKVLGKLTFLLELLLVCRQSLAQSGYNYARPDVSVGGSNAAVVGIGAKAVNNPLRPLVGGFGPAAATAAAAYPTASTAYGGTAGGLAPTTAFGGYVGQPQRAGVASGFGPTAAGVPSAVAGFAGNAGGLPNRPTLPQRTTSGIYGGGTLAGQSQFSGVGRSSAIENEDGDYSAIPGVPGVDYPIYTQVPATNFDCAQQQLPGYYSDVEALCQVFHICALNRTYSFLCPNGTVFSQETLVCVWWNQYDCASAPSLYANNAFIYDYGPEGIPSNAGLRTLTRTQPGFSATNTGRANPTAAGGIFGAGNLRATVGGGGGANYPAVSPTLPTSGFAGGAATNTVAGRYTPTPTATAQAFPAVGTPSNYGSVLRGGAAVNAAAAGAGLTEAAYANAQVASSSTNREYLPPRRP